MGIRPSSYTTGGGFLNNVDGKILDYEFTDVFPGGSGKKKKGGSDFHSLYCVLTVEVDGADEPVTTTLFAGNADAVEISEDGKTLTAIDGDGNALPEGEIKFGGKNGLGLFISRMCEHGFDESELSGNNEPVNLEAIIGRRMRFIQEGLIIEEQTRLKAAGKAITRTAKNGKTYPLQNLAVSEVYDAEETPVKSKGKAAKPAAGKAKGKAKDDDAELVEEAESVLTDLLSANDDSIQKSKLSFMLTKALIKNDNRDALKDLIQTEDFLNREAGWEYDGSAKKPVITASA